VKTSNAPTPKVAKRGEIPRAERSGASLAAIGFESEFTVMLNGEPVKPEDVFKGQIVITKERLPAEDTVSLVDGLLGAYPNAFHRIPVAELPASEHGSGSAVSSCRL